MAKKIVLNILINISIITLLLSLYWAFSNSYYQYAIAGIFALALFVYLKIQLVKSVRDMTKKP